MKLILSLIFSILGFSVLQAQELNCRVEVNAAQLEGSNKSIFETLQTAINEYVNTTRWTPAQFSPNEKIECTLLFTISKYDESTGTMEGTLQVQSSRPVYNSSYLTTLINFKDNNIAFTYTEGEPLLYSETYITLIIFRASTRCRSARIRVGRRLTVRLTYSTTFSRLPPCPSAFRCSRMRNSMNWSTYIPRLRPMNVNMPISFSCLCSRQNRLGLRKSSRATLSEPLRL